MTTFQFWRPIILAAVVCVATVLVCRYLLQRPQPGGIPESAILSLDYPRQSLSPRDVVERQMKGLTNREDLALGALQCYCFAAPANRLVTGPYESFARMVRTAPFDRLSNCASFSLGSAQIDGEQSRVLVSVVGDDRQLQVFAFFLMRQKEEPFEGCWMTAGVFALFDLTDPAPLPEFMPGSAEMNIPLRFSHPGVAVDAYTQVAGVVAGESMSRSRRANWQGELRIRSNQ